MNLQIRLSKPEDLDNILKLQADSLRALSPCYNSSQVESLIRSQGLARRNSDEIVFVAEQNSEIVGFSCLISNDSRIGGIFVHPNFIRQGIGTDLLDAIEKVAIKNQCKVIDVTSSLAAVKFYQANGYQTIRESGFFSEAAVWVPCVNLSKKLAEQTELEDLCLWLKRIFFF
ncbi:acetyltransferase, gnat family [Calothrix sp. PCC 7716]|nr:acetyltransferase, gnat family [Calothrix sp. PCC 7716]